MLSVSALDAPARRNHPKCDEAAPGPQDQIIGPALNGRPMVVWLPASLVCGSRWPSAHDHSVTCLPMNHGPWSFRLCTSCMVTWMAQPEHQPLRVHDDQSSAYNLHAQRPGGLSPAQKTLSLSIGSQTGHSQEVLVRPKWNQCRAPSPRFGFPSWLGFSPPQARAQLGWLMDWPIRIGWFIRSLCSFPGRA